MVVYVLAVFVVAYALFPIFWILLTSLKTRVDAFSSPPLFVFIPTLASYEAVLWPKMAGGAYLEAWGDTIIPYMMNSTIIASGSALLSLALGVPAAYALSRFQIRRKEDLSFWILSTRFAPLVAVALPLFRMYQSAQLWNTYQGMILAHSLVSIPFVIWLMRSFFDEVPREMEESAFVDGASPIGVFTRIALPMALSGIAVSGMFSFMFSWNEFLLALVLTGRDTKTYPVHISGFMSGMAINWGAFMAASTIALIPSILVTMTLQRYIVKGLTLGAVKG